MSTFAVLAQDRETFGAVYRIEAVYEHTDSERDKFAARYGTRYVYLPMGGHVGDCVRVNGDGEAHVVSWLDHEAGRIAARIRGLRNGDWP